MACEIAKIHKAVITAVHVIEIPFSMPLETSLYHRSIIAESILTRVEAIGREFNIKIKLRIINSRSVDGAIIELLEKEDFDLLVLGNTVRSSGITKGPGAIVDKILKSSPAPVWICFNT